MRTPATRDPTSKSKKQRRNRIALTYAQQLEAESSGHGTRRLRSASSKVLTQRKKQMLERCLATACVYQVGDLIWEPLCGRIFVPLFSVLLNAFHFSIQNFPQNHIQKRKLELWQDWEMVCCLQIQVIMAKLIYETLFTVCKFIRSILLFYKIQQHI